MPPRTLPRASRQPWSTPLLSAANPLILDQASHALQDHRLEVEVYMFICTGLSCTTTCTCPPLKVLLSTQKQKQVPYYFYLIPQQQGLALPSTRTVPRNPLEQIQRIPFLAPTHASLQKHKGIPLVCSHRMQGIPHTHMLIS